MLKLGHLNPLVFSQLLLAQIAKAKQPNVQYFRNRPRGKESTEVRITQNKGKERENSYQKLKRSPKESHTHTHA